MRAIHEHVRCTDTVTGRPYAAADPALLLWVHVALVDSVLVAARMFGTPPAAADADAYVREMAVSAELLGVPGEIIPVSVTAVAEYLDQVRPERGVNMCAGGNIGMHLLLDESDMKMAGIESYQPDRLSGRGGAGGGICGMTGRRAGTLTGYEQEAGNDRDTGEGRNARTGRECKGRKWPDNARETGGEEPVVQCHMCIELYHKIRSPLRTR